MQIERRSFIFTTASALLFSPLRGGEEDPWPPDALLEPDVFASRLRSGDTKSLILYVGFPILFKGAHITGAKLAGPCSKAEGIVLLRKTVDELARDREIVVYCGCCPFTECPNIRPAYRAMRDMQFTNFKVLHLATNLHTDWTAKGYPVEKDL